MSLDSSPGIIEMKAGRAGIGDGMYTFKAARCEAVTYAAMPSGQGRGHRVQAPGRVVMVLHEGSGWVRGQDGSIEVISGKSVVTWDEGDWIEYGSDGSREFRAELYWEARLPEQELAAVVTEVFGLPD